MLARSSARFLARSSALLKQSSPGMRMMSSQEDGARVTVIGGAGGIGQPLSLLLKLNEHVSHVSVLDVVGAPGVAADLSHVETASTVSGHGMTLKEFNEADDAAKAESSKTALADALKGADIVVIPAGVPRKPGMTRQDLFEVNANLVASFADGVAENCPDALVAIISNPVNSTVPIFAETMKKHGKYDKHKVFGVTSLDVVRANTFVAEKAGVDVAELEVPVVGGHAGASILPLISQANINVMDKLSQEDIEALTDRIQNGGTEVVNAKAGAGSATLSMGYAGARFVSRLLDANAGEEGVIDYAFVESEDTECQFFATALELGKGGWKKSLGLGELTEYEQTLLEAAKKELQPSIDEGIEFVQNRN